MANEVHLASEFIYHRLTADAALTALVGPRVYHEFAGPSAVYPHVLILFLAATDANAVGADQRIFTRPLFLVEAVTAENTWATAQSIADRIEARLLGASGTQSGVTILGMYREGPMRRVEITPEGQRINHYGGRWRSFVQTP
jgi:hypothetical protein